MTNAERIKEIEDRAAKATEWPWSYRSQQYDDWGMVRGADGLPVAVSCMGSRYIAFLLSTLCAVEADNARLRAALGEISRQQMSSELDDDQAAHANFQDGYDACVAVAIDALQDPRP